MSNAGPPWLLVFRIPDHTTPAEALTRNVAAALPHGTTAWALCNDQARAVLTTIEDGDLRRAEAQPAQSQPTPDLGPCRCGHPHPTGHPCTHCTCHTHHPQRKP